MSTGAWIRRQRDRPIAESERRGAMAAVAVLLAATALLLALTRPDGQPRRAHERAAPMPAPRTSAVQERAPETGTGPLAPTAARAASLFLAGYLGYLYGHASASAVRGATAALIRSLRAHPPRVSPVMRARRPRILALHAAPAPPGHLRVSALVNDGGLVDYSIGLLLAPQADRLLVTGLDGD